MLFPVTNITIESLVLHVFRWFNFKYQENIAQTKQKPYIILISDAYSSGNFIELFSSQFFRGITVWLSINNTHRCCALKCWLTEQLMLGLTRKVDLNFHALNCRNTFQTVSTDRYVVVKTKKRKSFCFWKSQSWEEILKIFWFEKRYQIIIL